MAHTIYMPLPSALVPKVDISQLDVSVFSSHNPSGGPLMDHMRVYMRQGRSVTLPRRMPPQEALELELGAPVILF